MKTFYIKASVTLGIFLLVIPVFVLIGAYLSPDAPCAAIAFPLAALIMALCIRFIKRSIRIPALLGAFLLLSLYAALLYPVYNLLTLLPLALSGALLIVQLNALCRISGQEWPSALWYSGILLHLVSRFLLRVEELSSVRPALNIAFPCYILYTVFLLNRISLSDSVGSDSRPSRLLIKRNRITVFLLAVLALAAANIRSVIASFKAVKDYIREGLIRLLLWLASLFSGSDELSSEKNMGSGDNPLFQTETAEPSAFALILEKIVMILAMIAAALLACFVLYILYKKVRMLVLLLLKKMRAYKNRITENYTDTAESLLDFGEIKKAVRERANRMFRRREKPILWGNLDSRARVRRIFAQLLEKRPKAPANKTARELLISGILPADPSASERISDIYDMARYSSDPISPEDAEYMQKKTGA